MRQLLPTIGLLLLAIPATAQDAPPWANKFFTSKDDAPPRVIVQDFGTLPKGTVRTYRFTMTNIYAVAMDVAEPKPSCGCVSIVAYTGRMESRETGFVDIKIDTSRVEGFKRVDVPVRFVGKHPKTGEPFYSTANLEVRTVSRPDILMNPGAFAFNVVPLKQKSTQVITVAYSGRMRGWKITDVGYKKELLDVTVEPLVTRTGVSYQVTATLKGTAPAGTIEEQIVLKTNDPDAQALTLNVSAIVQAPLSLSEEPLRMGKVAVGQTKSRRVIVKAEKDFKVVKVDGQGDGVSVPLVPALASKSQVVMVSFTPEKVGAVKKILTIATEDGDTVTLTVEAMAVEAVEPDK